MAALVGPQPSEQGSSKSVFDGADDETDPLLNARDEQIQRIIDANGGPIATIRQFSADLAESNQRVTQERNNKQALLEETRQLREENELLKASLIENERRYDQAMQMLKHSVEHSRQHSITRPDIKVVDSPGGPYLLDSSPVSFKPTILTTTFDTKPANQAKTTFRSVVVGWQQIASETKGQLSRRF